MSFYSVKLRTNRNHLVTWWSGLVTMRTPYGISHQTRLKLNFTLISFRPPRGRGPRIQTSHQSLPIPLILWLQGKWLFQNHHFRSYVSMLPNLLVLSAESGISYRGINSKSWCQHIIWSLSPPKTVWKTSRMRTSRLLTVSPSMHCAGGGSALEGVCSRGCLLRGMGYPSMHWGRPPHVYRILDKTSLRGSSTLLIPTKY